MTFHSAVQGGGGPDEGSGSEDEKEVGWLCAVHVCVCVCCFVLCSACMCHVLKTAEACMSKEVKYSLCVHLLRMLSSMVESTLM